MTDQPDSLTRSVQSQREENASRRQALDLQQRWDEHARTPAGQAEHARAMQAVIRLTTTPLIGWLNLPRTEGLELTSAAQGVWLPDGRSALQIPRPGGQSLLLLAHNQAVHQVGLDGTHLLTNAGDLDLDLPVPETTPFTRPGFLIGAHNVRAGLTQPWKLWLDEDGDPDVTLAGMVVVGLIFSSFATYVLYSVTDLLKILNLSSSTGLTFAFGVVFTVTLLISAGVLLETRRKFNVAAAAQRATVTSLLLPPAEVDHATPADRTSGQTAEATADHRY